MTSLPAHMLIIGGNSAIARHLMAMLPNARAVARTGDGGRVAAVGDYRRLGPRDFAQADVVVNCAGIVAGPEAALRAVNVDLQAALARAARDGGARRYVAISSFSIFGVRERIDRETPTAPAEAYGRSKLDGERALERLWTDRFSTLSVAFPAIIGTTRTGKVERMLRLWRRTRIWPVPVGDVRRAMIGAQGAAQVLAHAIADDRVGRVLAADPVAFSYRAAAQWLGEDLGGAYARLPVPPFGTALLRLAHPSLHRSTMTDSTLDPASNYAIERGVESSLRRELTAAVARGDRR